jgi:hypothetical protein
VTPALIVALLLAGGACCGAELTVDKADRLNASASLGHSRKLAMANMPADPATGVRGYRIYPGFEGPCLDDRERLRKVVAHMACHTAVFGIVELEAAQPFPGADDIGIFTKYRFRLIEDWRQVRAENGRTVDLVMAGGEVTRDGITYRVEHPHALYRVGGRYVLIAGGENNGLQTIHAWPAYIALRSDVIGEALGGTPFAAGTSVAEARSQVAEALPREGCH